jgi:membrane protein DedA with SNARE-associated domain
MTQHVPWALFVWVLANQGGVPVPVAPWLLAAGALAGSGSVSVTVLLACVVTATLGADLLWYGLGRWRGARTVAACSGLMRAPSASVSRAARVLRAHRVAFMWSARFLPELNPVAAGLAGATHMTLTHFLGHAAGSAVGWAGVWIGVGYLLGRIAPERAASLSVPWPAMVGVSLTAAAVSALIALVWRHRQRTARRRQRFSIGSPQFERGAAPGSFFRRAGHRKADERMGTIRDRCGETVNAASWPVRPPVTG